MLLSLVRYGWGISSPPIQRNKSPEIHMKELTQNRLKELLHYNPDTGIFSYKIRGGKGKRLTCGHMHEGYMRMTVDGKRYMTHRLIWLYVYGHLPKEQIDHKNQNKSDNRISNLRAVDARGNCKNRPLRKDNKSGFNGVCWIKRLGKWASQVNNGHTNVTLGMFLNKEDAINARKAADVQYNYHPNHGL